MPPAAQAFAFETAAIGLAAVLQYLDFMFAGNGHYLFHISRNTAKMHRDNRLCFRSDLFFHVERVNHQGLVNLGYDRDGADHQDGGRGGHEGITRHNYFVARPDAHGRQAGHQSRRSAAGKKNSVFNTDRARPFLFKTCGLLQMTGLGITYPEHFTCLDNFTDFVYFLLSQAIHMASRTFFLVFFVTGVLL